MNQSAEFQIVNRLGLHARAAAQLVQTANRYLSDVTVEKDGVEVNAKSIMGLLMLAAPKGSTLKVSISGEDAEQALAETEAMGVSPVRALALTGRAYLALWSGDLILANDRSREVPAPATGAARAPGRHPTVSQFSYLPGAGWFAGKLLMGQQHAHKVVVRRPALSVNHGTIPHVKTH